MKKILWVLISTTVFAACSKKGATPNGQPSILGKWTLVNTVVSSTPYGTIVTKDSSGTFFTNTPFTGTTTKDSSDDYPGQYSDFRTDGKVYSRVWDNVNNTFYYDTSFYGINYSTRGNFIFAYTVNNKNGNVYGLFNTYIMKDPYWSFTNNSQEPDTVNIQVLTNSNLTLYGKSDGAIILQDKYNKDSTIDTIYAPMYPESLINYKR